MDTSTWLLTGASSGLGYALADYVLNHGDRVVLAARTLDATADLAERHPTPGLPSRSTSPIRSEATPSGKPGVGSASNTELNLSEYVGTLAHKPGGGSADGVGGR